MATNGSTTLDFTKFYNVIDGQLVGTEQTRCSVNPATMENNPDVPISTQQDVDKAVAAAQKASESWAEVPWEERSKALGKLIDAIEEQSEAFVHMLTREQGKPLSASRMELQMAIGTVRATCKLQLPDHPLAGDDQTLIRYTPLGVAVGIVPWNFPVQLGCLKASSAIITGNAFILKASPFTPYCDLKIAELAQKFFPPGVFQALSGDDSLGPMLTAHPGVDKVSFTGSTATGKKVMESCAKTLKRVTLELGGNDPAIVCADNDPAAVAPAVAQMAVMNSGQVCVAVKRIYIHESIYSAVLDNMVNFLKNAKVGNGLEEDTLLGPICNKQQFERIQEMLADIDKTGLKIAHGSAKASTGEKGLFITPTIIDNPPDDSRIVAEEPFGPVFPVMKWSDEADVIRRANNTDYGLGASVWTRNMDEGARISKKLKAGMVWINSHAIQSPNAPFGGHKGSGIGVEYGVEGLLAYCNLQTIATRPAPA